jgi:hypothetical protein
LERLEERCLLSGIPLAAGQAAAVYGQLPLSFEANQGQTDPQVNFLTRGQGYALFLTPTEAVLNLGKGSGAGGQGSEEVLRMELVGGNKGAHAVGLDQLPGTSNYFVGNDLSKWHTGITTYGRVEYQQVYRGIDLVYYGNQSRLEYDFVVAPAADPNQIALRFDGVQSAHVDGQGNLVLHTAGGDVVEHAPVVYQRASGVRGQGSVTPIAGSYVVGSDGLVRFQVGAYDHSRPLTIDPVLVYATYLGGSNPSDGFPADNDGFAVAVDASGNAYVTGRTYTTDFPTVNPLQPTNHGSEDVFVAKVNAAGTALVYSTYLGGSGGDEGRGIAVDAAGNVYVTGVTLSNDFPLVNPLQSTFNGGSTSQDSFVAKLNASGTALVYSTFLGGSNGFTIGYGIAVDAAGNAYVTGTTSSPSFLTVNALQASLKGMTSAYVAKINAAGTALIYSTYLGGSTTPGAFPDGGFPARNEGFGVAVDSAGNAYLTGITDAKDFPTKNAFQPALAGGRDAFVTEINTDGSALVYSSYLGGTGDDRGFSVTVDATGNAYVAGSTQSDDFPTTPGAWQTTFGPRGFGRTDAFVAKVAAGGSSLVYSTFLGTTGIENSAGDVAVDSAGNAYIVGLADSFLTPTPYLAVNDLNGAIGQAFTAKLNPVGSALADVVYLSGANAYSIAVDGAGNAYITGSASADFTTVNPIQPTFKGDGDAFLAKINPTPVQDPRSGRFVAKAYQDLLHHAPDTNALNEWSLVLDQGVRRDRVAFAITRSSDYFTVVIDDLYQKYLKRAPDQRGMSDDLAFLTSGGTREEVEAGIIGSDEYFSIRCGGSVQGWKDTMYSDVFGRAIDPTGDSHIQASLDVGVPRRGIAEAIFSSGEFRYDFINGLYETLLGRPAEQAGINEWLGYIQAGHRDEEVIAGIVGSPEYFSHV